SVINVAKAESWPQDALVSTVAAGCSPVRVVVSLDRKTVWVTARGSDQLLTFSSQALTRDPAHARCQRYASESNPSEVFNTWAEARWPAPAFQPHPDGADHKGWGAYRFEWP